MHVKELFDLAGKVAIVTGGGRGIGLEIAEGLAEAGARVSITGRRREWLDPAEKQIREHGGDAMSGVADLTHPSGIAESIEKTVAHFGGLDIPVNNARISWGS